MNNKIDKFSRRALLGTILVIASVRLFAEDSSTELSKYDAVVAAPGNHQVVLENERVRILDVTIKPGEKEPFHVHSMPSVMVLISGSKLRITQAAIADGEVVTGKSIEVAPHGFIFSSGAFPLSSSGSVFFSSGNLLSASASTKDGRLHDDLFGSGRGTSTLNLQIELLAGVLRGACEGALFQRVFSCVGLPKVFLLQ